MWVQFKQLWQDGLHQYQVGMVVDLPRDLAIGYCQSGKAKACNPPPEIMQQTQASKKKAIPSARQRIKKMSTKPQRDMSIKELADELMEDES